MKLALALVVVAGVAIGLSLPALSPPPSVAAPAEAVRDKPVETVLDRSPRGHFYAVAEVNGEPIRFLVDTGASVIALTEADAKRAHLKFDRSRYEPVARGASGLVRGQEVRVGRVVLDGKGAENLTAIVMEGGETSLLGQNYLRNLDVRITGDTMTLR